MVPWPPQFFRLCKSRSSPFMNDSKNNLSDSMCKLGRISLCVYETTDQLDLIKYSPDFMALRLEHMVPRLQAELREAQVKQLTDYKGGRVFTWYGISFYCAIEACGRSLQDSQWYSGHIDICGRAIVWCGYVWMCVQGYGLV